jgi:two-component system chemotaxis response regulator CheY
MESTILVAEDSPSIRKFIALSLKLLGHKIVMAVDGMDALEKLPLQKVDLVITDLNMPNMDGYKLIESIRSFPEYQNVPIIILSSLSKEEDIQEGLASGANSYLVKPFNTKRIQYEVTKYLLEAK